jgi:hypothetical protein
VIATSYRPINRTYWTRAQNGLIITAYSRLRTSRWRCQCTASAEPLQVATPPIASSDGRNPSRNDSLFKRRARCGRCLPHLRSRVWLTHKERWTSLGLKRSWERSIWVRLPFNRRSYSRIPPRSYPKSRCAPSIVRENISAISSNMLSVGWSPVRRRFENRFFVTSSRRSKA